jgi:alkane 1-monooxygenase
LFGVYKIFGWEAFKFQMYYIIIGLYLFETVNYIEHYGILRKKDANGVYESINKMHSWNYLSGAVIVRIQRHSDHHAHSFRPYQILRRMDDAPYLAFEYLHCYFLATIPPLWFYIMNPKVEALEDIRLGRKNEKNI